jgi:hypothetical protein
MQKWEKVEEVGRCVVFEKSFSKEAPCSKSSKKGMKHERTWTTNQQA